MDHCWHDSRANGPANEIDIVSGCVENDEERFKISHKYSRHEQSHNNLTNSYYNPLKQSHDNEPIFQITLPSREFPIPRCFPIRETVRNRTKQLVINNNKHVINNEKI